ncbi:hypothetical protein [Aquabacterium sp.]|uniref:hypothetical protein n=1 Tax=Aquabacterium sp. TaxID=1872578 RepID=UPI0026058904|nr:hypothetical protein [Aquabacterium sp.]MDD2976088.1 hypothetical protein [Aquabacterium sp.]
MAQPATIHSGLRERASQMLAHATHYLSTSQLTWRQLKADAEKLCNADAASGSIELACAHHMTGNVEQTRYWMRNAALVSGNSARTQFPSFALLSNLGFFTEASRFYSSAVTIESGMLTEWFPAGIITGNFADMMRLMQAAKLAQLDLSQWEEQMAIATQCDAALTRLQVNDGQLQAMLDVAGEVLREHSLFWLDPYPLVRAWYDDVGAGVLYELKVGVSTDDAYALTEAMIDRLIERDLDAPGVSISFIGTQTQAQ